MQREFALPGTTPTYARDRVCDIQHIKLVVDIDIERRRIAGTCSTRIAAIADDLRRISLDAVELDIAGVNANGEPVTFSHDGRKLSIDLGRELSAGDVATLDIEYSGQPRRGLYFVGPDDAYPDKPTQVWTQGQDEDSRYWFPCFDSPHQKATSELVVSVPASWFALSNGALLSDDETGGRRTFHWKLDVPHSCYLITLAAGELSEIKAEWPEKPDVEVTYYVQRGREADAQRTLGRTPEMLQVFSERYGVEYPYNKYAQVFVADFIFGGMENTTATSLTDVVLLDERAALDRDMDDLVSHELAHQWFGDLLTCRDWGEGWLNEGFATYSEYIWREHRDGRDEAAMALQDWTSNYFSEDSGRYRRTVATKIYDEPIDIFDAHLYEKGGLILHMLRQVLGEDAFWKSIKLYLDKHRFGSVETRDLARAVEAATGRVLDWFFDQWVLRGAGHPELSVSYEWDDDANLAGFTIKQTQKVEGSTPLFRIPTSVRLRVGDEDVDTAIELTQTQQTFYVPCTEQPSHAIFDPGHNVLAAVDAEKSADLWLHQLANATEGVDRVDAAKALAKTGGHKAEAGLVEALNNDEFWAVRAAAATALGKQRTDEARDALIAGLTIDHPKARRAVAAALGQFRNDETAADALVKLIEAGDPSYQVEAAACLALGQTRSPAAGKVLRAAMTRESYMDVIRSNCFKGLAAARDESALDVLVEGSRYGGKPHGRRAALDAMAELVSGRTDQAARRTREHVEDLLRDRSFRVQYGAIQALETIGDPAASGSLRDLADRTIDGRLRRRAREVIRDLNDANRHADQLQSLRDELDKLRTDLQKLQARTTKLETQQG